MFNYLNVTYNQLLQEFQTRLKSDERFKNLASSTIYGMFTEMLAAVTDMTNFYIQRQAEESFISTARLDSSIIKHCKNLGYSPRRAVPARCELVIKLKGPLPSTLKAGTQIWFNRDMTKLSFGGNPYTLDCGYSYTFTAEDIANGSSADWEKLLTYAVPHQNVEYMPLIGINYYSKNSTGGYDYNVTDTSPIMCFQAEQKTVEILGASNRDKLGKPCQFYDIDDLTFSNWFGKRDPFAFSENVYDPTVSWCKVGIGPDEDTAMRDENLYDIELQSIYLNEKILELAGILPETPIKACLIDTNPDKTVRVTFSAEPYIADIGLRTDKDNLYVKYLSTNGKECNMTGVTGAIMTHSNQINVTVDGNIVNMTNNVQFLINSDIYGGDDFESQASMKINAPVYYSSRGKLVTRDDFMSYFRSLSSPINVQTAMVFGQNDMELSTGTVLPLCQNNIIYCLAGHIYLKNNDGNWDIRNILTDDNFNSVDAFSLYGDKYRDHLCDYVKMLHSYDSYYNLMYTANAEEQWLKNIRLINKNCAFNTEINTVLLSIPPYIQYFDVVGTVYVKPLTDIESYMNDMKNRVYEYLDSRVAKHQEIYKSEIAKLYNEHPATVSTDIDFKISDIVKSRPMNYEWRKNISPYEFTQDKTLDSYKAARNTVNTDEKFEEQYGKHWWNVLKISKLDSMGHKLSPKMFENRNIILVLNDKTHTNYNFSASVSSDDTYIYLTTFAVQKCTVTEPEFPFDYENPNEYNFIISLPVTADYYSTSELSVEKASEYGLDGKTVNDIIVELDEWLRGLYGTSEANRAIQLPYYVMTYHETTRAEEIKRKGNLQYDGEHTLSENTFWTYFVHKILTNYYKDNIKVDTDVTGERWNQAVKLIMDIYPLVKPGICDSILDSSNNITNFSTKMERACLRNCINIAYSQV